MTPTTVTVSHTEDGHIALCLTGTDFDLTFALAQDRAAHLAAWISDEIAEAKDDQPCDFCSQRMGDHTLTMRQRCERGE